MNDFDASWSDHRDELYARVVRRGRTIQWQRRAIAGTVAAIVLVIPLAAHAAVTGPSGHVQVATSSTTAVAGGATTSTSAASTTTTTATTPITSPGSPTTTPTSVVPAPCHNSYDIACGDFRWDRPPPTGPFIVAVSSTQLTTTVGTPVSVRFGFDGIGYSVSWDVGESSDFGTFILPSECDGGLGPMRGPWTPPPAPNPDGIHTESHTFATAGTYHVHVEAFVNCLEQQLPGARQLDFTIVVAPNPAATTTTAG